jgi:NADP-dependent 3-hydroxy acid dehydrogenase YdfG
MALCERFVAAHGGLDWLVCCASPPILPMAFDAASLGRVQAFVARSLALVAVPLAAALPALQGRGGGVVAVSSAYAVKAPASFAHYVAAKRAVEGLVESVVASQRALAAVVLRPPRLVGELHLPLPGEPVRSVAQVAGVLAHRLAMAPPAAGQCLVLDHFGSDPA